MGGLGAAAPALHFHQRRRATLLRPLSIGRRACAFWTGAAALPVARSRGASSDWICKPHSICTTDARARRSAELLYAVRAARGRRRRILIPTATRAVSGSCHGCSQNDHVTVYNLRPANGMECKAQLCLGSVHANRIARRGPTRHAARGQCKQTAAVPRVCPH